VITTSTERQAEHYRWELHRRETAGKIPADVRYLVVPDIADRPIGTGGATLNALRALAGVDWSGERVLIIHSGGARRLPQYSLPGKLFSAVPVKTPWGDASTVFDETLALSTAWVERLPAGLVVGSGDVMLTFDAAALDWTRPGVCGVAMLQPAEMGARHGVYVTDEHGRVYAFLPKASVPELRAAGGLLPSNQVALDIGLLRFCPESAARLTELARGELPAINLYEQVTMALTGQWRPAASDPPALHAFFDVLKGLPFWCSTVSGEFTHIGTTALFHELMAEETEFSRLYAVQQRLGVTRQPGLRSAGVVSDSVLAGGGDLGPATVVLECNLAGPVRAAQGAVLHGLDGIPGAVDVPENTVLHQLPVVTPEGKRGVVIRVYGVGDDPKGGATWFGRPMLEEARSLGLEVEQIWPGLPEDERTLWTAELFPLTTAEEAWACARWLLRLSTDGYCVERWKKQKRLSFATSAQWADSAALQAAHARRLKANWRTMALSLAEAGADIRPLLAHAPGLGPLAETGTALRAQARELEMRAPTEAASRYFAAGLFFGQAGLAQEATESQMAAFQSIEDAVNARAGAGPSAPVRPWQHEEVIVEGPARIDLGGGWSDTPPFCLDWGGTVLNIGVLLKGAYPIRTVVRRLREPVVRCNAEGEDVAEYRSCAEILQPPVPGDPFAIPRTALQLTGLFQSGDSLAAVMRRMGGGIEIRTTVNLPMGSGLGTSSILAATTLRAISEMMAVNLDNQALSDQVMRLEQLMTTGGGWQDQAGGIFPGSKLVLSGPGLHQRLRVQPVPWTAEREAEFQRLTVLFYTGIRRVARNLLQQVVGSYLARETACVQVLHSIKTLALEMSYAMSEGDWDHLGELLDRHWALNRVLDPNTTNAPINQLLDTVRPYIRGVKLAGAGGGGFLILLAREGAVDKLKRFLCDRAAESGGAIYDWCIAAEGLRVVGR
jgi:fucokinase